MTKSQLQVVVVLVIIALWIISMLLAVTDGNMMAKLVTPMAWTVFGWLFAERATGG